ncbi:MAG: DUF2828 family protein [Candidatus Lokiarchaeota archaeon]|nr:DUF2828 family protein [Candidatus Lokiarchaeota archaeon]
MEIMQLMHLVPYIHYYRRIYTMSSRENKNMKKKNPLIQGLIEATNLTLTENLAVTFVSSGNGVLDFYSMGAALRSREEKDINALFIRAIAEDPLLAMKALFYIRDIRGGQGERRTFRIILNHVAQNSPELIRKNFENISFFGRWDDFYALLNTPLEDPMFKFLHKQVLIDLESENPSLLAKWLPSGNTSSKKTKQKAKITRKKWNMTSEEYRKMLSKLRAEIDIVERKMCANKWDKIKYENVPSRASMIYRNAFKTHDLARYEQYLEDVKSGKKEIKASTLYPYDMMRIVDKQGYNETIELQWKNQPDWTHGKSEQSIVVCDTSGSMFSGYIVRNSVAPIYISTSLAIYFAERNTGAFKDMFITFSGIPKMQEIIGKTLHEKWLTLSKADWGMNTNLQAVFDLILSVAKKHHVSEDDMIKKIYIISDMEFDRCVMDANHTNFQNIQKKYKKANYKVPEIVFWNVESRQNQAPVKKDEQRVALVSGASPVIFETLMKGQIKTPVQLMELSLNNPRYDRVQI